MDTSSSGDTRSRERWRAIERLLDAALELPPHERPAFLEHAAGGDAALRLEVEELVRACAESEQFLDVPAPQSAAPLVAEMLGVAHTSGDNAGPLRHTDVAMDREQLQAALGAAYTLERELGRGGMATVYLARDRKHDRLVAMKALRAEVASTVGAERFLREIRLIATLRHPHILSLYDSGEANGVVWYTMPFVEGETLRQRLRREGRLPLEEVQRLAQALASALDYAHGEGIVHRDIKPENILLYQGAPMLADFGVALAAAGGDARRLTRAGLTVGTPAYMSPEQATGNQALDARSDVYSLGCVLYEALAGEPPHAGPNRTEVLTRRLTEPAPSLRAVRDDLPEAVERAITRALARSPADRPATAGELAAALTAPRSTTGPGAGFWTRRKVAIATALSVVALTAPLGMMLREPSPPRPMAQRQLTFTGSASFPAVSPDGHWLAYVANRTSLMVQELPGRDSQVLVSTGGAIERPRWSPDGSRIAFVMFRTREKSGATYVTQRQGGPVTKVIDDVYPFAWDASGKSLVRAFGDTLSFVNVATGRIESVLSLAPRAVTFLDDLAVSPDGRWIALSAVREFGVLSRDGRVWRRLGGATRKLRWNRAGDAVYFLTPVSGGADLMKLRLDPESGQPIGKPTLVWSGLSANTRLDLSADGHSLVFARAPTNEQIWTMVLEGALGGFTARTRQHTSGTRAHLRVDVSPDGEWIAYAQEDDGKLAVYVAPFGESAARRVASGSVDYSHPRWSSDGRRLAHTATDSAGQAILLWDRVPDRVERLDGGIAPAPVVFKAFAWSADGATLAYATDRGRTLTFSRVAEHTKAALPPPDSAGSLIAWVLSPDGQEVVAAQIRRPTEPFALWRASLRERRWRRMSGPVKDPLPLLWSSDGWVYFWTDEGDVTAPREVWRVRASGGKPEHYVRLPLPCHKGDLGISRDARRMACRVRKEEPDIWLVSNLDQSAR